MYNRSDVAIKMMKEGAMNEEDFIEEAKVMKYVKLANPHSRSLQLPYSKKFPCDKIVIGV